MTAIQEILDYLEERVPLTLQEGYDNAGLIIGDGDSLCTGILICIDITLEVLEEALERKCNLVISHHPLIFNGLKTIKEDGAVGSLIRKAIQHHLSIYAMHTNLDNAPLGVNHILGTKLGLQEMKVLLPLEEKLRKLITYCPKGEEEKIRNALFEAGAGEQGNYSSCSFNTEGYGTFKALENAHPYRGNIDQLHKETEIRIEVIYEAHQEKKIVSALLAAHPYEEVAYDCIGINNKGGKAGSGMLGYLEEALPFTDFIQELKEKLNLPYVRTNTYRPRQISKIAICGGTGSFLIPYAIGSKADVLITGDLKYHEFQKGEGKICLVDAGHYETEVFAKELIYSLIWEKFSNFVVLISQRNTNYISYL